MCLVVLGCDTGTDSTTSPDPSGALVPTSIDELERIQSYHLGEQDFVEIAAEEPSFAGYFVEDEDLVALGNDPSKEARVLEAVNRRLLRLREDNPQIRGASSTVEVRSAEFSFLQLSHWRNLAFRHVLHLPDVAALDLDEYSNRVAIDLKDGTGTAEIQRILESVDVPLSAVVFKVTGPIVLTSHDLLSLQRPVQGGFYIHNTDAAGSIEACTIGFNAIDVTSSLVFFTNSHCTRSVFEPDNSGTESHQWNSLVPGHLIGTESRDPLGWDCTPWWEPWTTIYCRYSDAAAFLHSNPEQNVDFGYIARTQSRATGANTGSIEINHASPRFEIVGKTVSPPFGVEVNKIGPRGGWTFGDVTDTCFTSGTLDDPSGNNFRVVCTYKASYRSDPGDSGAPVFRWNLGGDEITLQGINFGSDGSHGDGAGNGLFSPIANIETDFSTVDVAVESGPPPISVNIQGPSHVKPSYPCHWGSQVSGGSGGYTWQWSGVLSGSGSSIDGSVSSSGWLFLTVTDSQQNGGGDELYITVSSGAPTCGI